MKRTLAEVELHCSVSVKKGDPDLEMKIAAPLKARR
jgi:hypothetical protein